MVLYVSINEQVHFTGKSQGGEILGGIIAAVVGYYTGVRVRMRGFDQSVKLIREIADDSTLSAGRSLYVQMIRDRMQLARKIVEGFQHDTYSASSPEEFQGWVDAFFRLGGGNYLAVDSHPPSRYWSDYAWFLDAHAKSLRDRRAAGEPVDDVRILSVSQTELDDDFFDDDNRQADYLRFVRWHRKNGVDLRVIKPGELAEIRANCELATSDDIALWVRFAALFTPAREREGSSGGVDIKLRVRDDFDKSPTYSTIENVMSQAREQSAPMSEAPPGVEMGDSRLIARWNDYLGPDLRWRDGGPYESFLLGLITRDANVFDAAAGTGVDSVNLLARKYSVVSNEVDPRLSLAARDYARRRGVDIELKSSRWERLVLPGNLRFDVVLVLGNSLCLIPVQDRRRRALKAFFDILRPGGCLIIDERNYEQMRREREKILADPLGSWIDSRTDVMYPCRDVVGFPGSINASSVEWAFADNTPALTTNDEVRLRASEYHPLQLHAFAYGELFRELRDVGFEVTAVYADLEAVSEGESAEMPSYEATSASGFLTYVARRPRP